MKKTDRDYILEGIEIGLSTKRGSREEIINEVNALRAVYDKPPVEHVFEYDSPMAAIRAHSSDGIGLNNAFYGQFDIHWLQSAKAKEETDGLDIPREKWIHLYNLTKLVSWFWVSDDALIFCHKPTRIVTTPRKNSNFITGEIKVLHNPGGKAIEFADGEGVYAIGGIQLTADTQWIVTEPEKLTPENIFGIDNTDLRAEVIKMMGSEHILELCDYKVIDEASFTSYHTPKGEKLNIPPPGENLAQFYADNYTEVTSNYRLVELYIQDNRRVYLEMTCPSKGEKHIEGVPPHIKTVAEELARKEGITGTYVPPLVRT